MVLAMFKIALRLRYRHIFMPKVFNTLRFWRFSILRLLNKFSEKWKDFSKNRFLVESTTMENATFSYKTALPEVNVKTNIMRSTKWTYLKWRSFGTNYFLLLKICFNIRTCYEELIWCSNYPNIHIHAFCKSWSSFRGISFSVSILI